jgi:predicted phage tail component-like protein
LYYVKTDTIDFDNNKNFCIYKMDGLAPPSATLNFSTIANVDGVVYNSGRINQRNLVLYVKIFGDIEANRNALYSHFPVGSLVRIYFKNETHDVYIDGYIETFECDFFTNNEIAQISIICPDPYFNGTQKTYYSTAYTSNGFEFPFSIEIGQPIEISTNGGYGCTAVVNSDGTNGFTIEFEAVNSTVTAPYVTNTANGQTFRINTDIAVGEKITINTNRHHLSATKTHKDGTTENVLSSVSSDSQWVQLLNGKNTLFMGAGKNAENLAVLITVEQRILGV